ncbi:DUF1045 domain-containing protein [Aestuariibius sp. HNIBRBA575]|uniref:DUF1045 domain-containing protein n=1 Tax=Aestuariibius sp. HNIBRBA575 TaxID=3233343 RepID=UPI0034A1130F
MSDFTRFALYYVPEPGALADFGASWLGWDLVKAEKVAAPEFPGLSANHIHKLTQTPRKYGFHGTLKPPFRLANGCDLTGLDAAVRQVAQTLQATEMTALKLDRINGFLALTPVGDTTGLNAIAQRCVEKLDPFRAPSTEEELERRRKTPLTPVQDANLLLWGYPYVFDDFRFHITLTGQMDPARAQDLRYILATYLDEFLPRPFCLDQIALVGERPDGRFQLIQRYDLTG